MKHNKPNILVVTTGGTITMSKKRGGALSPSIDGKTLLNKVSGLHEIANVTLQEFSNLPSSWLGWKEWFALSSLTNNALSDGQYDGVVIVQGTDTIEELSYFLHLTVKSIKPIVFTGAMRGADSVDYDGEKNLLDSIRVATTPSSTGKGTLVVMNGEIHSARDVLKLDKYSLNSLSSGKKGVLGIVDEQGVTFYRNVTKKHTHESRFAPLVDNIKKIPNVHILYTYSGMNNATIEYSMRDTDGIIVVGAGIGNVDRNLYKLLSQKINSTKIVISSRAHEGRISPLYEYEGGIESLRRMGCIMGEDLHPLKARILLTLGIIHNMSNNELQKAFEQY